MAQEKHIIESTSVIDANMAVSRTSACYAFTTFFFFMFHIQIGQFFEFSYLTSGLIIEFSTFDLYIVLC